ncbi:MAG: Ig-like domain-containing protein, partial [Planctomycetaceae bacterium]|nr:Ig-like domain-containing protein [Planctomycetaceae bacterium]
VGDTFMIVANDGSDAVVGTFTGLPEGATFVASGGLFRISYVGGTGNDIVLTVVTPPNTPPSNVVVNVNPSVFEQGTATVNGSFTDPDAADTHTVVISWGAGEGTTTLNLVAGATTFSASHIYLDDGPPGTSSDVYTVSAMVTEPAGASASGSASITVNNVAPTAVNESAATNEDQALSIAVLANDSDVAGALDPLQIVSVTNGSKGTTAINTKGTPQTADDEIVYTPNSGATGSDSFTYTISDGDGGVATATVSVQIRNLVDLSGRVFDDKDNDGSHEPAEGDVGIGGVTVQLFDESSNALVASLTTAADGTYLFDVNAGAGTYKLAASPGAGFLDGRETAGNLGGNVDNTQDNGQITGIRVGEPGTTTDAIDYFFARILPSQALGMVWLDADDDGEIDMGESAIAAVAVELTGLDDRGQPVSRSATTDASGAYAFSDLRPSGVGGYAIRELQPAGYVDGRDTLGTVNGVAAGDNSASDAFSGVVLPRPNSLAEDYNFGERTPAEGGVQNGQTAAIGFWQNKNGQNLIKAVNGSSIATKLGNWLAATFPNMYGNLAGQTNAQVAAFYKTLFARTALTAAGGGPPKMDAQVMATALAVYVTNESLAGTTAAAYGFVVTASGVGARTASVGASGAAFGVADNTSVSVLGLLLVVNSRSHSGLLYDLDHDGDATDSLETSYRTMANDIFSGINEAGDI